MSQAQILLTIGLVAALTLLTRALPFLLFNGGRKPPAFVVWRGGQLPRAVMVMLVVYCLKDVSFDQASGFVPALLGVAAAAALHLWKRRMILSIVGATGIYMLLIRVV